MTSETNRVSSASLAFIQSVCASWGWSWQPISQENDDGIDGLLYLREIIKNETKPGDRRYWKHEANGALIQAQIKSGASYIKKTTLENLEIEIPNLEEKKSAWKRTALPCALIFVKSEKQGKALGRAWWVDLKSEEAYSANGRIIVPLKNRFEVGIECRKPFSKLAAGQLRALELETVNLKDTGKLPGSLKGGMGESLKKTAWNFYISWRKAEPRHPLLGDILINRTGWSHITRQGRPVPRIETSFRLLPAAARILEKIQSWKVLRRGKTVRSYPDGSWSQLDFLGVSANVIFPDRGKTEVIVILRRELRYYEIPKADATDDTEKQLNVESRVWFYSVYEPGRGKGI